MVKHHTRPEDITGRSFWERPEGVTGKLVIGGLFILVIGALISLGPVMSRILSSGIGLIFALITLGLILFMALDPKMRNLVWYFYKKSMRWITGLFVKIDPLTILKNYVKDLGQNVRKIRRQIGQLRGQMHQLQELTLNNKRQIEESLKEAEDARNNGQRNMMIIKSRRAARIKESNSRLEDLYNRMEVLYRILGRMHDHSEILYEDILDQVELKEQERKAIHASHTAMQAAMNVIRGNPDKKEMFDRSLEMVADDVSQKVGEMEEFMLMSENFMESIDLENGIFQEKGLEMLEEWETRSHSLLSEANDSIFLFPDEENDVRLDLNTPRAEPEKRESHDNQYDSFFD